MKDIIAPQAPQQKIKPIKRKKPIFIIVAGIIILFLSIFATYMATKYFITKKENNIEEKKETNQEEAKKEEGEFVYVSSKSGLNLREDSSTVSDIVWTLPFRAKVKVEKRNSDSSWYKTTYNEVSGWFKKEYTQEDEPSDETLDWESVSKKGEVPFELKYPKGWKVKTAETEQNSISIVSPNDSRALISVEILSTTTDQASAALIGEGKNIGGKTLFSLNSVKGLKYIIQTVVNNKVVYTEDIILIEKNNKVIKIAGPADGESDGDIFNVLVWTVSF
jgi:uncharacterized protein YgiM (DUF1202 family)